MSKASGLTAADLLSGPRGRRLCLELASRLLGLGVAEAILHAAHDHAARGKGHARHGDDDTPFLEQPTMKIGRMVGLGYPAGQIMKKTDEAKRMVEREQYDAAVSEFLGVINYAAAAILLIREL